MVLDYLHNHPDFIDLLRIVGREQSIEPALIEKDYWIMHCLYGLQKLGMRFELKGGTSLSKGFSIIKRFSEDIDIRIEPPEELDVKFGRNHNKPEQIKSRKNFYDMLAKTIRIDGIEHVTRDHEFDDEKYRSGGIRLHYKNLVGPVTDLKDGILLEVGFDDVTPNTAKDISAWAYDYAVKKINVLNNQAKNIVCYHPGYTLVEKLQTISTKYRKQQSEQSFPKNFMRHYYDVYCLLDETQVQGFIGTKDYQNHKKKRFRSDDNLVIAKNEAFLLNDPKTRQTYIKAYESTRALYYSEQPDFENILERIHLFIDKL